MMRPAVTAAASVSIPVFCVGNLIAGGAGKTPTAIAVAKIARKMGMRPGFLSRGYGGSVSAPTLVDVKQNSAHDVGDEPLILALYATTVVSADRPKGAQLLEEQGVDLIIMDDGFQNPSLHKDYSLVVVDARRGIGNGFCIPAGPLRAKLQTQLAMASSVLLIGQSAAGADIVRRCARSAKPVLSASIKPLKPRSWKGKEVLAYCGIADPQKFHASLADVGAEVMQTRNFADHHPFTSDECRELLKEVKGKGWTLATTEKDWVRLMRSGEQQEALRAASQVLQIELAFENPKLIELALQEAVDRAAERRAAVKG
jgi:tetraacyldisaccharide 4'-kinase